MVQPGNRTMKFSIAVLLVLLLGGCAVEPQPVMLGAEECTHCRMVISDLEFAAQALNTRGKAYKFDAVECMAEWVLADRIPPAEIHSLWVADRADEGRWIPVMEASFLRSDGIRSPMGLGLIAHASEGEARLHQRTVGGEVLAWNEVLALVESEGGAHHGHSLAHDGGE
jgi:copper chaperone NosL